MEPYPQQITTCTKDKKVTEDTGGVDITVEEESVSTTTINVPDSYQKSWLLDYYDKCQPTPIVVASLEKTSQPEIYQLSLKNKDSKSGDVGYLLDSIGYAHLPTLKMSRLIRKAMEQDDKDQIVKVNCSFNTEFEKWQPLSLTEHEINSYEDFKQQLVETYQSS